LTAAHCVSMIRAFEIVENVEPALECSSEILSLSLVDVQLGKTLEQDFALIPLPDLPSDYLKIADNCQPQYIIDEINHKGESGRGLLNEKGEVCGVLSRCKNGKSIYSGLSLRTPLL
jgi:hypothetical protein